MAQGLREGWFRSESGNGYGAASTAGILGCGEGRSFGYGCCCGCDSCCDCGSLILIFHSSDCGDHPPSHGCMRFLPGRDRTFHWASVEYKHANIVTILTRLPAMKHCSLVVHQYSTSKNWLHKTSSLTRFSFGIHKEGSANTGFWQYN